MSNSPLETHCRTHLICANLSLISTPNPLVVYSIKKYKLLEWVKTEKTNFCGVDWRELANEGYYDASQKHVKKIGTQLASFFIALNYLKVKIDSIRIAGHSLGAHVAGFAGKKIYELTRAKISTIFGLGIRYNNSELNCDKLTNLRDYIRPPGTILHISKGYTF